MKEVQQINYQFESLLMFELVLSLLLTIFIGKRNYNRCEDCFFFLRVVYRLKFTL